MYCIQNMLTLNVMSNNTTGKIMCVYNFKAWQKIIKMI